MNRTSRSLAVLAAVALIGAGGSSSLAATHSTASKKGSSAPGKPAPKGYSGSKRGSSAPGKPAPKGSSGSKRGSSAPGKLPSKGSSGSKRGSSSAPGPPLPR